MVSAIGEAELTLLASMARATRLVSSLTGTFEWNSGLSFVTGSVEPSCGIPLLLTRVSVDSWVIPETDLGGPLASPRWRFCGFGRGLGSNKKVEMTLSALGQTGCGSHRAHLCFSLLALFNTR